MESRGVLFTRRGNNADTMQIPSLPTQRRERPFIAGVLDRFLTVRKRMTRLSRYGKAEITEIPRNYIRSP